MSNRCALCVALSSCLVTSWAWAESETPATEMPAPTAPSVASPVEQVVVASVPAAPSVRDDELARKIEVLEGKVASLEAAGKAGDAAAAEASKLRFSESAQGRYEWYQEATNGAVFDPTTNKPTATNSDRFMIRHAFFNAQYKGVNAEYLVQIDANSIEGVVFKEASATLVDTWTPLHLRLSVGQFKYPFGYEIIQANFEREMPERASILKFFFDGWRDRGARLQGRYGFFNFQIALVNGTIFDGKRNLSSSKDPGAPYPFGSKDPNEFKDWVGRLGVDFGSVAGGLSGYFGKGLYIAPPTENSLESPDSRYKIRLGVDVQGYVRIPGVGDLALKGEAIYGKDMARQYRGIAADPCKSSATWGFILTAVQRVSDQLGVVLRIHQIDTLASSVADSCTAEKAAAERDRVLTLGGGLLYYGSPHLKATVTYEHPAELDGGASRDDDFAMAQLQTSF